MNAMILAAGRGTRLGQLGLRTPKILLDVDGAPLLGRHLSYLEREKVERVVVNAHHLADQVESFLGAYAGSLDIELVVEPELLGTAGAVRNVLDLLGTEPFVVLYGDVIIDEPLRPLFQTFHQLAATAVLTVYEAAQTAGKGVVEVGQDGRVLGFREKQQEGPGLVNAGLYVLAPAFLADFPPRVELDFGVDVLPAAVARAERIFAHRLTASVLDIGTPDALENARALMAQRADETYRPVVGRRATNGARSDAAEHREPSISVVICAYSDERWNDLTEAVLSVETQSRAAHELIVVVDHNPRLLERARRLLTGLTVVPNSQVRGLGGARNSGVAASTGGVVAFLDDDAVASPRWLEELAAAYGDPAVIGVGGSIRANWEAGRPAWFPAEFDWVVGCTYKGMPLEPAVVRNLIGCNMSYRREACERLGGFRLGYGCDETEFCIRIGRTWPHRSLRYVPAARVDHRVPRGRGSWRHFGFRCYFEGGSKAVVSWLLSSREGLSSERRHAFRTLPRGVWRGICDTASRGDPWGLVRAFAIVAGLAFTGAGYGMGRLTAKRQARRRGWDDDPRFVVVDEIGEPLDAIREVQ
jgi:glucosyl-dolichyl phosphate glucuronosyltransferase